MLNGRRAAVRPVSCISTQAPDERALPETWLLDDDGLPWTSDNVGLILAT